MDKSIYNLYLNTLKKELVPALGCTEPIAIAYAGAMARKILGNMPTSVDIKCSGNIIKNVMGVIVPNSNGMRGIPVAVTLGIVGGNADESLSVLESVTDEHREITKKLLDNNFCKCSLAEDVPNLYIDLKAEDGNHSVEVEIKYRHTQISKIVKDGQIVFEAECKDDVIEDDDTDNEFSIEDIVNFADTACLDEFIPILKRQIEYNSAISKEGLSHKYGACVGATLLNSYPDDVKVRARAAAAAGSDARMNGCSLPVIINSGSGNQGMTVSLPVIEYAKEWNLSDEKLYRALIISNLVAIHQKRYIGDLSAYCGVVCAACGSGAAITYMAGGSIDEISNTIINTITTIGGMVCDGAKASCAAKIASAVDTAIMSSCMSMKGLVFQTGEGLVKGNVEKTIKSVGRMGREGMKSTDKEILNIMLEK